LKRTNRKLSIAELSLLFGGWKMRLLEQTKEGWSSVATYLDSLLLPVYRYKLKEKQLHLTEANLIEYIAEELEKRLIGRVLLLPAVALLGEHGQSLQQIVTTASAELGKSGFHFSFLVIIEGTLDQFPEGFYPLVVNKDVDRDLELERLYEEILNIWQSV
jgi:hypothetical protein